MLSERLGEFGLYTKDITFRAAPRKAFVRVINRSNEFTALANPIIYSSGIFATFAYKSEPRIEQARLQGGILDSHRIWISAVALKDIVIS